MAAEPAREPVWLATARRATSPRPTFQRMTGLRPRVSFNTR